jgi:hypothetical protein
MLKSLFLLFFVVLILSANNSAAQDKNGEQISNYQSENEVLAQGNPPLRQRDAGKLRDFFEWLFETKFSTAEQNEFQSLVIKKWNEGETEARGIVDLTKTHAQIQTLSESDREKIRLELLPKIAASFQNSQSELNSFMSGIYQNSRKNSAARNDSQNSVESERGGAATLADFAGTWSSGNVSGIRYKNLTNGDLSSVSGNASEYIISKNGDIQYTGYLSTTIYACETKLFFTKKGKISVSGSTITFDYKTGERDYQNSCNASLSGVKPIPPQKKTVPFTLERSAQGVKLCTTDEGVQTCLYKVN